MLTLSKQEDDKKDEEREETPDEDKFFRVSRVMRFFFLKRPFTLTL